MRFVAPWILSVALAVCFIPSALEAKPTTVSKPNVILFLADDLGYMDSSVYGSEYYETPNLERLADHSVVFTNAYAPSPQCSPSRAGILAGKYPARLRLTRVFTNREALGRAPRLVEGPPSQPWMTVESRRALPLAERTLAEALKEQGYATGFVGKWHLGREPEYWPEHQGFDVNVGGFGGATPGSYFDPYKNPRLGSRKPGEYVTDRLTSEALAFVEENRSRPFFLLLSHFAVHAPWGHKEAITRRFRDKSDPRGQQGNPVMASMIFSLDQGLGRLLDKLEELDLAERTIFVFTSDNGGNVRSQVEDRPATSNAPLRDGKGTIYEGGLRVPLIVRVPGIHSRRRSAETVMAIDLYPTILELTGGTLGTGQIVDGVSLVPALHGGQLERDAIFWHFPHATPKKGNTPSSAVRRGRWKLIRYYGPPDRYELYDLEKDEGELVDLAARQPELVAELDFLLRRHLEKADALVPLPNPAYRPASDAQGRRREPAE